MSNFADAAMGPVDNACSLGRDRCGYAQDDDGCSIDKAGPCREAGEPATHLSEQTGLTYDLLGTPILEPEVCTACGCVVTHDRFPAWYRGWRWCVRFRECKDGCQYDGSLMFATRLRVER